MAAVRLNENHPRCAVRTGRAVLARFDWPHDRPDHWPLDAHLRP